MKKITLLALALIGLIAPKNVVNAQHDTTTGFDFIVNEDGVWTWYNDERAVFKNNKLYTSYVKRNGRVGLSVNDIKTGANIGTETLLSTWSEKDDHNNASILLREDGKIMSFYTAHIREKVNYFRTSVVDEPSQQSDWGPQVSQITSDDFGGRIGATYNNAYQLSAEGGRIYNFMRTNNFNPNVKEYLADGTPVRNGEDQIVFKIGTNGFIRPYLKCASNNVDRIDFFLTDGHPVNVQNNLYHCYYKTNADGSRGNFYQTDGTFIATMASVVAGTPIQVSSINKLYVFGSDGTSDRPWTHSINYDVTTGHPVVTYSKQRNINTISYHYATWNGTQWNNFDVTDAGQGFEDLGQEDYTGLITTNPYNTNEIFMSSNRNPITGVEDNRYEIYSAITPDGGNTWNWTEVTKNSIQDNLRPYLPKGITNPEDRVVLWFHGDYFTYLNYRTRVVGEYINKVYDGPAPVIPDPIAPINTDITYGVDINSNESPNLSPFVPLDGVENATATDKGVKFTLFGKVSRSRDRGSNTFNDVIRDLVFGVGVGAETGIRIENLPTGTYTINSFHFDNNYSAPVSVILREQGGAQIGEAISIVDVESPAVFSFTAEAGKAYEVVATGTSSNGSRFNGLSLAAIAAPIIPIDTDITYGVDINSGATSTLSPFKTMNGVANETVLDNGVAFTLFGTIDDTRDRGRDNSNDLLRDFVFGAGTGTSTGMRIENLPEGEYIIKSYHFDSEYPAPVSVSIREQGGPMISSNIVNNEVDPSVIRFYSEAGKTYEIVATGTTPRGSRFNGISLTRVNVEIDIKLDMNSSQGPLVTKDGYSTVISPAFSEPTISAFVKDNVNISFSGNYIGSRTRNDGNDDLTKDFIYGDISSEESIVGITGLPVGTYTLNSYHFDYQYPAPVRVTFREKGGPIISSVKLNENTDAENNNQSTPITGNSPAPASFNFIAEEDKTYELAIVGIRGSNGSGTSEFGRGSRFNGLEIKTQGQLTAKSAAKSVTNDITTVFPNPFTNVVNIESNANINYAKFYGITGKLIKVVSLNKKDKIHSLKVEDLFPGIYFVKLYNNDTYITSKKLFKR